MAMSIETPAKPAGETAPDARKPGPAESDVQIRPAGPDSIRDDKRPWDKVDEEVDESFPASDPPANY